MRKKCLHKYLQEKKGNVCCWWKKGKIKIKQNKKYKRKYKKHVHLPAALSPFAPLLLQVAAGEFRPFSIPLLLDEGFKTIYFDFKLSNTD